MPYGDLPGGARDGIILNDAGVPLSYLVEAGRAQQYRTVAAADILHVYTPRYTRQRRGFPMLLPAIPSLKLLDEFSYELNRAARNNAALSLSVEYAHTPEGEDAEGGPGDAGPAMKETLKFGGGVAPVFGPGFSLKQSQASTPWQSLEALRYHVLTSVAASLGVSYYGLSADVSRSNYTAHRAGALIEREIVAAVQQKLVSDLMIPLLTFYLENVARLSMASVSRIREGATWAVQQPPPLDAVKQANADKIQVGMFTKSLSEVIRERGAQPEKVFTEIAADLTTLTNLGVPQDLLTTLYRSSIIDFDNPMEAGDEAGNLHL